MRPLLMRPAGGFAARLTSGIVHRHAFIAPRQTTDISMSLIDNAIAS